MGYTPVVNWGTLPDGWSFVEATAVAVDADDDVWVASGGYCCHSQPPVSRHWNGRAWSVVRAPSSDRSRTRQAVSLRRLSK